MRELSNDELAKLPNEALRELFLSIRSKINNAKRNKRVSTREEVYFCYISREIERRSNFSTKR